MTIANMKELIRNAVLGKKAVGAFNVGNMEMIIAAIKAAEDLNCPIIMQIAEKRLSHSPLELMGPMMVAAAKNAKVEIAVHFDHGTDIHKIKQALELGFTSAMFDGSHFPMQENIDRTKEVIHLASRYGAAVEGEIGIVGGSEGGNTEHAVSYTKPEDAVSFAAETGLDALAIAIGNAHGNYPVAPDLRFDILQETSMQIDTPLVLHGGTGLTASDFKKAISLGIRKVNIATSCYDSLTRSALGYFEHNQQPNYFGLNEAMIEGFYHKVKEHILIFNE
ncbi:ketose-bisphosphate aldolase [Sinanaerobacter chloroacetimidivorans]|jgi:fructose-bisphosphate aldolase class II|uniref:Ketose-bisphosphate aldolase n=1 Tax=Sinanaerobacter chloroacetimidivorans TaxID=2818044 RepID=A0A8J8B370_9FIRM|nr:ketose-bisphosphate aldolase [Sinanaerobacter chloroacetimidivorans]MBR0600563.1 ketose-bisphosphate aldolase [Sinanaerobacter chloroacetimidivorans]